MRKSFGSPELSPADSIEVPTDLDQLRAEYCRLAMGVRRLHAMIDQTDPHDPIGVALTRAGLERAP